MFKRKKYLRLNPRISATLAERLYYSTDNTAKNSHSEPVQTLSDNTGTFTCPNIENCLKSQNTQSYSAATIMRKLEQIEEADNNVNFWRNKDIKMYTVWLTTYNNLCNDLDRMCKQC